MPNLKLGRLPRRFDPRVPQMTDLMAVAPPAPPIPERAGYQWDLPEDLGMMLNDTLGDCTCAGFYHGLQIFSGLAQRSVYTAPDSDVLALYEGACGYNPQDPSTDQGGIEQNVLTYLLRTGAPMGSNPPHKISGFFEINVANHQDVCRAIYEAGVVYIGFNVPAYLMNDGPPSVWAPSPKEDNSIVGGHCVVLGGYGPDHFNLISWGQKYRMTWGFWDQFVDEAYAIADPDWIEANGRTPLGLTPEQLAEAMKPLA